MPEVLLYLFSRISQYLEHGLEKLSIMVPDASAPDLIAVEHYVILSGSDLPDLLFISQPISVLRYRSRKRIMRESPLSPFPTMSFLKKWEIHHPRESQDVWIILVFSYIRSVTAVFFDRFFIRNPWERNTLYLLFRIKLRYHLNKKLLIESHDIFLIHKAHFQVHL